MDKVILYYIATSLDGFIADSNGGVAWFSQQADPEDVVGFKILMQRIGTILMGSASYIKLI